MKQFHFHGEIASSKSMLNRALVALSYHPELKIIGDSSCDDVRLMQSGLTDLLMNQNVECGQAGTVLRFLSLRASRIPGYHVLKGSRRLFSRPQNELLQILGQLGVDAQLNPDNMIVSSRGWRLLVDGLQIHSDRSSQFASSVILNSWGLKSPLHFHISRKMVSEDYFRMTVQMMKNLGMRIEENGSDFFIPANQKILANEIKMEPDVSSIFVVAALAAVNGEASIANFPDRSLQADAVFVELLRDMGVLIQLHANVLHVSKCEALYGITANIERSPDLFPVLSVLCALAKTESNIYGVGHLKYKESSRLVRSAQLIEKLGAKVRYDDNHVRIYPTPLVPADVPSFVFDVDQDHRMAMAALVAKQAGFAVKLSDTKVITKSFPELISITEGVL